MKLTLSLPGFGNVDSPTGLPQGVPTGGLSTAGINVIGVVIDLLLIGAIIFSLWGIFRGAVNLITSGGDKEKFAAGRERIRYALLGLIIIFLTFFLVNTLGKFFGVDLLKITP